MSKKFNGLLYRKVNVTPTKKRADALADAWRKYGFNARVVKEAKSYSVYVRESSQHTTTTERIDPRTFTDYRKRQGTTKSGKNTQVQGIYKMKR